jgi:hypothetical protein
MSFCSTNRPQTVTKFIAVTDMNLVTLQAAARYEVLFNKQASAELRLFNKNLKLG